MAFIVFIALCCPRNQRALRAYETGFAVAASEINNAQSKEQSMGENDATSDLGSALATPCAVYDRYNPTHEEFPLIQCVNRPMAVSLAARNITAISASKGGKYKVCPTTAKIVYYLQMLKTDCSPNNDNSLRCSSKQENQPCNSSVEYKPIMCA